MEIAIYKEALDVSTVHRDLIVTPVTDGLINQTFKVVVRSSGFKFLLQQINDEVFPEPEKLQANYDKEGSFLHVYSK